MNLTLRPEQEKLVDELRKSGRYPDAESVLAAALLALEQRHAAAERSTKLSAEERIRRWDEFMAEIDRDPPTTAAPLSDEALSRESIYDDERHRI